MTSALVAFDRRGFLLQTGLAAGVMAMSGAWPTALLAAPPAVCLVDASRYPDTCGDWTVDHVCSHWPPYAFHTGSARPHTLPRAMESAGADWHWVA